MSRKVTIFGATGPVGTSLCDQLSRVHPEWEIQAVTRNPERESQLENVKLVAGDALSKDSVLEITRDSDVIISCVGFPKYEVKYWSQHWPVVVENLLLAVTTDGKRKMLIFCDNLYAYGTPFPELISTKTQPVEASLKGKPNIRSFLRQTFQEHMKKHPGTLSVVGGSDFFGSHVTGNSFLGDTLTGKIVNTKGKATALAVGSADKVHDFCYAPDFARALMIAAGNDASLDRFWICPHAIHGKTIRQIAHDVAKIAGKPKPSITVLGKITVCLLSPFMSFMGEMKEMLPNWTTDYQVDDSEFCKEFDVQATPYEEALAEYVKFYESKK